MANQLTTSPFVIDTAGATILTKLALYVKKFEFTAYNTISDTVIVKDRSGNIVWQARGKSDFSPITQDLANNINGLQVSQLDSGKLLVYFG